MSDLSNNRQSWLAKALIGFAIGAGVGFGLCTVTLITRADNKLSSFATAAGAAIFFVSLAGLALTIVALLVDLLLRRFSR